MGPLEVHLARIKAKCPGIYAERVPNAGYAVHIPNLPLGTGWNKAATEVHFLAPDGYPYSRPDCFWADEDLRLANGCVPQNAQLGNPMPGLARPALWFSWHLQSWNAARDDLNTWICVVQARLRQAV